MSRRTARPVFVLKPLVIGLLALHGPAVLAEEVPTAAPVVTPVVAPVAAQTPAQAQAQSQATATESTVLEPVEVESAAADEALPQVSSPKYTAPLRDTPQSVQVIPKRIIEEQGQLTLRDMLGNVPGITLGAAEGGNGFGDNITLRGARIENDIQVDGIRDSAQTARVDPFNLEQLEITKGASSVYSGGGAVAGAINMVSKTAKKDEFVKLGAGVGTDNYYRATVDANTMLGDTTALRVNVMTHENDTPDRDHVWAKRWGIATSLAFGLGTDTRFSLNYLHQDNERVPDRGILWRRASNPGVGAPVPVDRSTYFGWSNTDRETAVIDTLTALLEKDINDSLSLRNATRFAKTENYSNSATMNGLVCIGGVPFNATGTCPTAGDTFSISTNIGNVRDDETAILANVTDLTWNFSTGGVGHTLVTGLSVSVEDFERTSRQPRNLDGSAFTPADDLVNRPVRDLHNP
ncbi:MAG: TonB-dependent receptor plug domain-containing protein, partial [Moraxellaceae bacterium]|nr:TonB-dependent receptor plug domain-containing protein [Moraxellaceae bacterium]